MPSKNDKKSLENIENTENEKDKNDIEEETSQELLNTIAEDMFLYYEKHKTSLKWKSLEDIFFSYVENDKKIIKQVETKLWKELSFDDIKNLYLKTHYTLEEGLTKDIFKTFKEKNAIKSVIKTFQEKINSVWYNIDFNEFLDQDLSSDKDVDEFFTQIKNKLHNQFKNTPEEDVNKIKNIKITNEEIIEQLKKDGIIKNESYLKSSINELRKSQEKEIENILNIQTTLLNANIINNIYDIEKKFNQISQDIDKIWHLSNFSTILSKYDIDNITKDEIDEFFKKIEIDEEDKKFVEQQEEKINNASWESKTTYENSLNEFKKRKVLKVLSKNKELYLNYIANHEKENNEDGLANILSKLLDKQPLTEREKNFIINDLLKNDYIDNITRFVTKGFNLTTEQENKYKQILEDLLDSSKNTLELPNKQSVNIKKNIYLPEIESIEDIFAIEPVITFDIVWDDVDVFKKLFPNYFTIIKDEYYSVFTKTKIKDNEGNEYIWYIQESIEDWKIDIYESNPIENDTEPIKTIDIKNIETIELKEDKKLSLDSRSDLRKLSIWMVSYFEDKKRDYGSYRLYETIKEIKDKKAQYSENNESTKSNKINESIDYEEFKKEWDKLEWDKNTPFKEGSTIQIKWKSLDLPWISSNRFYAEIVNIDKKTWYFKLKVHSGWLLKLEEWEWIILEIPMIPKWLTKIKFDNGWNIFKFNKINNIQEFWKNLKDIELKSDFQWLQKWLSLWSNNIEVKDNKLVRKNEKWEYEEIKYMWNTKNMKIYNLDEVRQENKHVSEKFDAWEIEVEKEFIILKHPYDKSFSKKLDLNTFLMLSIQNKLTPWTENDFKLTEQNLDYNPKSPESRLRFFSFESLVLSVKQLKDNFSYYFKEEDELKAAEIYEKIAWTLPDFWFLWDVKMEAGWEKESRIWRLIENSKSRLERAWEWKGKNHGKKAAKIIEDEIFKKVDKWEKLSYRKKLKAAWYLIYALEKGPGPYFRALANYEGKWYWVRALFGENHYIKWKSRNKQLQEQLKKDPWNMAIRDELIKSEIFYMKDIEEWVSMYSNNFGSTIEGLIVNSVYSWWKVQEAYDWESIKWNYYMIRDWLKSYMINNRPPNSLWALKALSESVEDYDNYIDYYKIITSFIFTWYLYNNYSKWFWEQFNQICRTYWIPIWLFWTEYNWINKVLTIFDYIVEKKWLKPWGKKQSFTEFLFWKKDSNLVDVLSITSKKDRAWIMDKLENFWSLNGESIVHALDYTDISLLKWTWDDNIEENKKNIIKEYFWKVNDSISEDFGFNDDLGKTSYAPYYQNWIFNVPTWTFGHIALNLYEWDFSWKNKSISKWVWKWIETKLEWIQDVMHNDEVYEFLTKKFINWFGRFYIQDTEIELIKALVSWDSKQIDKIIVETNKDNYGYNWHIPLEMEAWLKKFAESFKKRPKNIQKVLNNVFGEHKVKKAIW